MRVCIVTYDEYANIPYVQKYEEMLTVKGIYYDIILWNRSGQGTDTAHGATHNYFFGEPTRSSKISKIIPFLKWRSFVKDILRREAYDGLIICTTLPGVLITDLLTGPYRGKYILDTRDFTYENWPVYKKIARKNLSAAGLSVISSRGFLRWLPAGMKPVVTHNISNTGSLVDAAPSFSGKNPLTIGFVGGVRYYDINKKVIRQFGNHTGYKLLYVGKHHPGCNLPSYCVSKGIYNVEFLPRYRNEQKPEIYDRIDLVNSIYGTDCEETTSLLPHKLYDCVLYKKPIIVSKHTYLEEIINAYGLGLAVDVDHEDVAKSVKEYVRTFDPIRFSEGCVQFLNSVSRDEDVFQETVGNFLISL